MTSKLAVALLANILLCTSLRAASFLLHEECQCLDMHSEPLDAKDVREFIIHFSGPDTPCQNTEIIATLENGSKVCLDPNAKWVHNVIQIILGGSGEKAL